MQTAVAEAAKKFALVQDLREGGHLSPTKFIDLMQLDIATFAAHARVHRNTVARSPASPLVQAHIRDNLRVLRAAFDLSGGDLQKAIVWFKNEPLPEFGYQTPQALVVEGRGDDLLELIESYSAGALG